MADMVDPRRIEEVCAHFRKFADTIERLVAVKNNAVTEKIVDVVATVGEGKRQLNELVSVSEISGMGADIASTVLNLRNRYEALEGVLKELRNDVSMDQRRSGKRIKPLQPLPGDDDR